MSSYLNIDSKREREFAPYIVTKSEKVVEGYAPSSLQMYYKFEGDLKNEVTGTVDASIYNHAPGDPKPSNKISYTINSKIGRKCVAINEGIAPPDGTANQGLLLKPPVLNSNELTVSFWYYSRGSDGWEWVWRIHNYTSASDNYECVIYTSGGINLMLYSSKPYDAKNDYRHNITTLQLKTWYHIAMVASGSTTKFYINGDYLNDIPFNVIDANKPWISNLLGGAGTNYSRFDEFRLFNTALTADEIRTLYEEPSRNNASLQSLITSMTTGANNKLYDMSSNLLYNPIDPDYIPSLREAAIEDKNQLIVQQNTLFALSAISAVSVAVVLFMIGNRG